jgi:hypothetical protein
MVTWTICGIHADTPHEAAEKAFEIMMEAKDPGFTADHFEVVDDETGEMTEHNVLKEERDDS